MAEAVDVRMPQSPGWWAKVLTTKLSEQAADVSRLEMYYEGRQPGSLAMSATYRKEFAALIRGVSDNWLPIVVEAVNERMHVEGARVVTSSADAAEAPQADRDAWDLWQRNHLDADSEVAHATALIAGRCPILVWWDDAGRAPTTTIEHPDQVYVAYDSANRRLRRAAIKQWTDEWTGGTFTNVYLPDEIHKFVARGGTGFEVREDPIRNPLGVVPFVELRNRCDQKGRTKSEMSEVLSTQDQIDKLVCDMLVASEFAAFRQRWATGIEIPNDPETGEELPVFKSSIQRLFHTADPDAKFGEFSATDLGNYTKAIENRVQSLASRSRTPPHYMLGQSGVFPSGETIKSTETGLTSKAKSRMRQFGESWEEVIRLMFAVQGDARRDAFSTEMIWADPETRSESEHVDALVKLLALGVPKEQLWADAGYTPQQIERFNSMLLSEALTQALAAPAVPEPVPATVPAVAAA